MQYDELPTHRFSYNSCLQTKKLNSAEDFFADNFVQIGCCMKFSSAREDRYTTSHLSSSLLQNKITLPSSRSPKLLASVCHNTLRPSVNSVRPSQVTVTVTRTIRTFVISRHYSINIRTCSNN